MQGTRHAVLVPGFTAARRLVLGEGKPPPASGTWLIITSENTSAVFSGQSEHQASLDSRAGKQTPPRPTPSRKELQSHCKDLETGKSKCFHCCLQSTSDTTEGSGPTPTVPPACPRVGGGGGDKRCYRLGRGSGGIASSSADLTPDFLKLGSAAS